MKRVKSLTALFLIALFSMVMFVSPAYADTPQEQSDSEWTLVFSDEFNGTEINETYWNKYPAAIDEEDYFYYGSTPETVVCPENVFVENGSLIFWQNIILSTWGMDWNTSIEQECSNPETKSN